MISPYNHFSLGRLALTFSFGNIQADNWVHLMYHLHSNVLAGSL
ncbi:hypothetical protein SAMN05443246_4648 [Paenibacillus sp. GP183]|jgi:hypothetical protein|nr:hypothetical protein SAMN05443246_4648 [Paenibacillus sp. GP183]